MSLNQVIRNHYDNDSRKELKLLLQSLELYVPIDNISRKFYSLSISANTAQKLLHFDRHALIFVSLISGFLQKLPTDSNHDLIVSKVLSFSVCLMVDALYHYRLKPFEIFDTLAEMIHNDDYLAKNHHRNFYWFFDKVIKTSYQVYGILPDSRDPEPEGPQAYFVFNIFEGEDTRYMKRAFFIDDLGTTLPNLGKLYNIVKLFLQDARNYHIIVTSEDLPYFLAVFQILHRCGRISVKNSRGLFKHLASHLKAPQGKSLPDWKDLRQYYNFIMRDKQTKQNVFKVISPLLKKYIPENKKNLLIYRNLFGQNMVTSL